MSKLVWRVLASLAALACGLLITAPAHAATVTVSAAEYAAYTQQGVICGHVDADGNLQAPTPPAWVRRQASAALLPIGWHNYPGMNARYHLTGNGLPTRIYLANHDVLRTITVDGHQAQIRYTPRIYRAWVPDFRGAGCDTWTVIERS